MHVAHFGMTFDYRLKRQPKIAPTGAAADSTRTWRKSGVLSSFQASWFDHGRASSACRPASTGSVNSRLGSVSAVTIIRREHRAHFTIVPNAMFLDKRLSIEAKGVLGFLLSRPHNWQVRLDHVGRTLRIGRKKLQRIFRELISAGYVTREQQRILDDQRFGEMDYVVRDVPEPLSHPVDNSPIPRGQNGTAAPRVQKGPAYKETPRVRKGPAYKELLYKNGSYGSSSTSQ